MAEANATGKFWTSSTSSPKRSYRFLLSIDGAGGGDMSWLVTQVKKPSATVGEVSHKYLNHTFYYPGRVEWDTCQVTLVDPVSPNAAGLMANILAKSGYVIPGNASVTDSITKQKAVEGLGTVTIKQFSGNANDDAAIVEKWVLKNAFVTNIDWGELSYESDDLTNVTLTLRYDYATLETKGGLESSKDEKNKHDTGKFFST
jgi:hypothetical protein